MSQETTAAESAKIRQKSIEKWLASETANARTSREFNHYKIKFDLGINLLDAVGANDVEEVKSLISRGCDLNYANADGLTSLHRACINERLDIVTMLVENGADVNPRDFELWTPLHAVATTGPLEIVVYLVEHGADLGAINSDLKLPVDLAEEDNISEYLEKQMRKQNIDPSSIRDCELNAILDDLKKNHSIKEFFEGLRDDDGATLLHVAAAKDYLEVVKTLLQEGADPNIRDNDGWTPLHAASYWGNEDICKQLLFRGADPKAETIFGTIPRELADEVFLPILDSLIEKFQKYTKPAPPIQIKPKDITLQNISQVTGILKNLPAKSELSPQEKTAEPTESKSIRTPKLPPSISSPSVKVPPTFPSTPTKPASIVPPTVKLPPGPTCPMVKSPSSTNPRTMQMPFAVNAQTSQTPSLPPRPSPTLPPSRDITTAKLPPSVSSPSIKQSPSLVTSGVKLPPTSVTPTVKLPPTPSSSSSNLSSKVAYGRVSNPPSITPTLPGSSTSSSVSQLVSTIKTIKVPPEKTDGSSVFKQGDVSSSSSSLSGLKGSSTDLTNNTLTLSEALEKIRKLEEEVAQLKKIRDGYESLFKMNFNQKKISVSKDNSTHPSISKPPE